GETMLSMKSIENYVVPLLRYAHERGVRTQINTNLTLDLERYKKIIPYVDVLNISYNYSSVDDFVEIGFAKMKRKPSYEQRKKLFDRMVENAKILADEGVFVSAETMLNARTLPHIEKIHETIAAIGCRRHEVHPMYPSDFASELDIATLD